MIKVDLTVDEFDLVCELLMEHVGYCREDRDGDFYITESALKAFGLGIDPPWFGD